MVMETTLLDAALEYAGRGWPVFPLKKGGKTPLTVRGFKDASTDPATIRAWWTRWPEANIGIPTGAQTFDVVDVDPRHGGEESMQRLIQRHGQIPDTPLSLTGGGGYHYCFEHRDGFRNSAGTLGAGIDTRGEGGYIVAPPSVHASGKAYSWEASSDPAEVPLATLPDWLFPGNLDGLDLAPRKPKADGTPVEEGGRNNALASLSGQWLHQGMSLHEVMARAHEWNKGNPVPLDDKEIERTVASVTRTHLNNNPAASVPVAPVPTEIVVAEPLTPEERETFPPHLLEPPGFVGELARWINQTAIKPQPILALGNALAFWGAVIGRKVATPSDLRTNFYVLGVGESGCGKDHSRKCVKRLCAAAGLTEHLLGGEELSSDAAILSAVHAHPSVLFQLDEIGHLIRNSTSKYAATHLKNIPPTLTKLFSSASTTMIGKEYADRKNNTRKDIEQPNVCIYGTTVPSRLYEGLSPDELRDGFLGRMLVFQSNDPDPVEQDADRGAVPESLVQMVLAWHQRKDQPQAGGNVAACFENVPHTIPFEPEAEGELKRFRARCRDYKAASRDGNSLDALWSRAVEHAAKVAMAVACGCEFQSPIVSGSVMAWSVQLVEHLIRTLSTSVGDSVSGSDFERDLLMVYRAIKSAGSKGMALSQIVRTTRRLTPHIRKEVLNQLMQGGNISKRETKPASGRPATVYFATKVSSQDNCSLREPGVGDTHD